MCFKKIKKFAVFENANDACIIILMPMFATFR